MKLLFIALTCMFIGTLAQPTCNGQAYNAALYTCTINDQGRQVLCPSGFSSCGSACYNPSQYCCQSGGLRQAGQCSGGTSQPTSTTQQTSATRTTTSQQTSTPPSTTSQPQPGTCNGQAYDRNLYDCPTNEAGRQVLCPKGNSACGTACYNAAQYCCQAGQLRQAGQCTGQTSSTRTTQTTATTQTTQTTQTTTPPSSSQPQPGTCNGQAYDRNLYDCPTNEAGQQVLCPKGNSACGSACYLASQYCCQGGQLRQPGQCSGQPPTSTSNPGTQTCTSGETYNPATSFCCSAIADSKTKVCANGQHCCGNILNGTSYFGPQSVYVACYNPAQSKCCFGGTSSFFNPSNIEPLSYQIPPNTFGRTCIA